MKVKDILGTNPKNKKYRGPRKPRHRGRDLVSEGGHGVDGVGAIHISEIKSTLAPLEKALGVSLYDNALGSVGKKEFSGDIDVAINVSPDEIPELIKKLEALPQIEQVKKSSVIMTKVKIQGYDESKQVEGKERTGYVQVDFMLGDPEWLKTYYHSPHQKNVNPDRYSKYTGQHRNIMMATIASVYDSNPSTETIEDGRPVEIERWMWSPSDGLVRIIRRPTPRKDGKGYTASNKNEIIASPIKNANEIAKALNLGSADSLYSFETLWQAINKHYSDDDVKKIHGLLINDRVLNDIGLPEELS